MRQRSVLFYSIPVCICSTIAFFVFSSSSENTETDASYTIDTNTLSYSNNQTNASEHYLKSSDNLLSPIPKSVDNTPKETDITLWDDISDATSTDIDGVPGLRFYVDTKKFDQLSVGSKIHASTPHTNGSVTAELSDTKNQLGGIEIWTGEIEGGGASDMMIITRGTIETHVVVTTSDGVTTTIIDNASGEATLVDEADYVGIHAPVDDSVLIKPIDDTPPEHLTQITQFSVGEIK